MASDLLLFVFFLTGRFKHLSKCPFFVFLSKSIDFNSVLAIRILKFLGLPDPDPLVRDPDPALDPALDPDPSFSHKGVERTEIMK
jgi:hypothetical protein